MQETMVRELLSELVDTFYDRVRIEAEIGPVFSAAVADWGAHKAQLLEFWSSIILKSGTYRGNPMARHREHPITRRHFEVWLELWRATCRELLPEDLAVTLIGHAERIAVSLLYGIDQSRFRVPPLRL